MQSMRLRVTPDLLAEVREGLQGRGVRELRRMAFEIGGVGVSFTWLFHVQHGTYKSEPGAERVRLVHEWLAAHPDPEPIGRAARAEAAAASEEY